MMETFSKWVVIVVDIQGDFTEFKNGSLAVKGTGEAYIKLVEEKTKELKEDGGLIIATQDWHPVNHVSFSSWPVHCVQGTPGSKLMINKKLFEHVIKKGQDPKYDSYSGFKDDGGKETSLNEVLKENNIEVLIIYGIAIDYCVKATVLDALELGYRVVVNEKLSRGVSSYTSQRAIEEMISKGAFIIDV